MITQHTNVIEIVHQYITENHNIGPGGIQSQLSQYKYHITIWRSTDKQPHEHRDLTFAQIDPNQPAEIHWVQNDDHLILTHPIRSHVPHRVRSCVCHLPPLADPNFFQALDKAIHAWLIA